MALVLKLIHRAFFLKVLQNLILNPNFVFSNPKPESPHQMFRIAIFAGRKVRQAQSQRDGPHRGRGRLPGPAHQGGEDARARGRTAEKPQPGRWRGRRQRSQPAAD